MSFHTLFYYIRKEKKQLYQKLVKRSHRRKEIKNGRKMNSKRIKTKSLKLSQGANINNKRLTTQ